MGITGLLSFLEKATSTCHLRELRGKCVAIDSYCWLHKGAFGCAEKLARNEPTDLHIQYCLKYVNMLLSYGIKPILVFDGRHLPAKAGTESKRREQRETSRKRAAELLRLGKDEEARSHLRRCVDITHEMALQLIQACRQRNIDCIVAPYEADAQLAFLNRSDIAQFVITEDSDLVLFGCSNILFKLDLNGVGRLIQADKLHLAMGCREEKYSFAKFRHMCILSGCDYLDSLPGIGLAKACKFVLKTEDPETRRALGRIPGYLNMRQLVVTEEYKDAFLKAEATFKHMVVYDPLERKQRRLIELVEEGTVEEHCCNAGTFLDEDDAFQMALGNVDPFSFRRLDTWHPDDFERNPKAKGVTNHASIWRPNFQDTRKLQLQQNGKVDGQRTRATSFTKRVLPSPDLPVYSTQDEPIEEIVRVYSSPSGPPSKRACTFDYDDMQALENLIELEDAASEPMRNPFAVPPSDSLMSPTKISRQNRSLLANVSPVKRIEYPSQPGKLSRFKRSSGSSDGQKVISRFFSASGSGVLKSPTSTVQSIRTAREESRVEAAGLYLSSPEAKLSDRGERTPKKRPPDAPSTPNSIPRTDSGISISSDDAPAQNETHNAVKRLALFDRPADRKLPPANDEDEDDVKPLVPDVPELPPAISQPPEQKTVPKESPAKWQPKAAPSRSNEKAKPNTKSAACRRPGLTRAAPKEGGLSQSKLSMFGFQKKASITLENR